MRGLAVFGHFEDGKLRQRRDQVRDLAVQARSVPVAESLRDG